MSTFTRPLSSSMKINPTYVVGNVDKNLNMSIGLCPACSTPECINLKNNRICQDLSKQAAGPGGLIGSGNNAKKICQGETNIDDCKKIGCNWDSNSKSCGLPTCSESKQIEDANCCISSRTGTVSSANSWTVGQPLPDSGICNPIDIDLSSVVRNAGWVPLSQDSNSSGNCVSLGNWSSLPAILFYISLLLLCLFIYFWARKTF
mgnify:CR=1 FL=1